MDERNFSEDTDLEILVCGPVVQSRGKINHQKEHRKPQDKNTKVIIWRKERQTLREREIKKNLKSTEKTRGLYPRDQGRRDSRKREWFALS